MKKKKKNRLIPGTANRPSVDFSAAAAGAVKQSSEKNNCQPGIPEPDIPPFKSEGKHKAMFGSTFVGSYSKTLP